MVIFSSSLGLTKPKPQPIIFIGIHLHFPLVTYHTPKPTIHHTTINAKPNKKYKGGQQWYTHPNTTTSPFDLNPNLQCLYNNCFQFFHNSTATWCNVLNLLVQHIGKKCEDKRGGGGCVGGVNKERVKNLD